MKLTALAIIIHPLLILAFSALAVATDAGQAGITNPGFHGLSQVLYEYASSAANNGSGFEGLADNTYFWNITTGIVMFLGRYLPIVISIGYRRLTDEEKLCKRVCRHTADQHGQFCCDSCVRGVHLCRADILPGAGAGPHR